jgi:hypothetical protein
MAKIKGINPIIPRNAKDPANQFTNLRQANGQLKRRYRNIQIGMRDVIAGIDKRIVPDSAAGGIVTNVRYEYLVDAEKFQDINLFIQRLLNEELLDSVDQQLTQRWWLNANLDRAAEDGVSDALQSAKNMAVVDVVGPELSQAVRSIQLDNILLSRGFQSRVALVQSRVFESMRGLTDSTRSDLADTLGRGMANGTGVKELTKNVMDRVNVSFNRSRRIVRTEVLQAYRTASREETRELNEDVYSGSDWIMQSLWFSALAPTSRATHIARHGVIHTQNEDELFYSKNANQINCLCSQSPILVNITTGDVLQEDLLIRMEKQKEAAQAGKF